MKNYFGWSRFRPSAVISSGNEQPLVQVFATGKDPSSIVSTLLELENLGAVEPRVRTDMFVRTITVCTHQQETVNAALICSFAVPTVGMNYLVYSLNESIGSDGVRIYIAALKCEKGLYSLAPSLSEQAWQQALGQIMGHGQSCQNTGWHFIDIGQQPLPISPCQEHANIKVDKASVMALLFHLDAAEMGQAIEYTPVASKHCNELVSNTADAVQGISLRTVLFEEGDEQDEQLDEVQASLNSIVAMAQELEQRHSISIREHQQLEERQNQLSEMERELNAQSKDLASRYAALLDAEARAADLQTRLKLLDEGEAAQKIRSQELALGQQKLSANQVRFSSIVKKFNLEVQFKGVAHQNLKELQVKETT